MPVLRIEVKPPPCATTRVEENNKYYHVLLTCIKPNHISLVLCLKIHLRYQEISWICSEIHENFWWGGIPPFALSPLWARRGLAAAFLHFFSQLAGISDVRMHPCIAVSGGSLGLEARRTLPEHHPKALHPSERLVGCVPISATHSDTDTGYKLLPESTIPH